MGDRNPMGWKSADQKSSLPFIWIESIKCNLCDVCSGADGLVAMTWAFHADLAKQAYNPGSNPGRRIEVLIILGIESSFSW